MEKIAAIILFMTVSCIVFSQEKQLQYTAVVPVINTTAKELHDRCIDWFSSYLNISDEVLIQSAENKIIAKPILLYYPNYQWGSDPVKGTITYTFEVDFEEGKFTYIINNFVHHGNPVAVHHPFNLGLITTDTKSPIKVPNQLWVERAWYDVKYHIGKQIMPLIANFKTEMAKAPEKTNE
jgi:hypothetical protein